MTITEQYQFIAQSTQSGRIDPDEAQALAGLLARREILGPEPDDEARLAASPIGAVLRSTADHA